VTIKPSIGTKAPDRVGNISQAATVTLIINKLGVLTKNKYNLEVLILRVIEPTPASNSCRITRRC
jgi:hypothetical protein